MPFKTTPEREAEEVRRIAYHRTNVLIGAVLLISGGMFGAHEWLLDPEPDFGNTILALSLLSGGFGFLSWSLIEARVAERYQGHLHKQMK